MFEFARCRFPWTTVTKGCSESFMTSQHELGHIFGAGHINKLEVRDWLGFPLSDAEEPRNADSYNKGYYNLKSNRSTLMG